MMDKIHLRWFRTISDEDFDSRLPHVIITPVFLVAGVCTYSTHWYASVSLLVVGMINLLTIIFIRGARI